MNRDGQGRPIRERVRPVVVVGAGASGLMSARALLRGGYPTVVLVERDESWGAGPAYSTQDRAHLLNVPASRLSVDSDRPKDFVEWAAARVGGVTASTFLPRVMYGEYLQDSLRRAERATSRSTLSRITAEVVAVAAVGRGLRDAPAQLTLGDGTSICAEHVVLALGNPPPRPLPGDARGILDDPWSVHARCTDADESIVLVGTGLTAIDIALSLAARGHRAPVRMVSRRGLLPRPHTARSGPDLGPDDVESIRAARSARSLLAAMRAVIAEAEGDWRAVFEAIRGDTNEIWSSLPDPERARLLRHAARYWEVHRHRMAPDVAAQTRDLVTSGRIQICTGAVMNVDDAADGRSRVTVRGARGPESTMAADWVVNCSGPNFDLRRGGRSAHLRALHEWDRATRPARVRAGRHA